MTKESIYVLKDPPRIVLKSGANSLFLHSEEVDWIEAKGKYTIFHSGTESYPVRASITEVEEKLDARYFIRIHRSAIVNISRIRVLKSWLRGEHRVTLMDGTELTWTRGYKHNLSGILSLSEPVHTVELGR